MTKPQHENETGERLSNEAVALARLGYAHVLGKPIPKDTLVRLGAKHVLDRTVLSENFLEAYPENSPHLQQTADVLEEFRDIDPTHPDYPGVSEFILTYFETIFGPLPNSEA